MPVVDLPTSFHNSKYAPGKTGDDAMRV